MSAQKIPTAMAQAAGPSYQEVLDRDTTHAIPAPLRYQNPIELGLRPYRADRYTSQEFFDREVERVWMRAWQYACRTEEIPKVGDTFIYENVGHSLLVTRQGDGSIRAFRNICRHRGRRLATLGGCKREFRCPYHGLSWNIDGSFRSNPFEWDFPQIDPDDFPLAEAQVAVWEGFVFMNFDGKAPPLLDLIGIMPEHFRHWRIEDCYKAAHVGKYVDANWKACAEAFLEGHHVATTHPQALPFNPCERTQFDMISDHVTRFAGVNGMTGGLWQGPALSDNDLVNMMLKVGSRASKPGEAMEVTLAPGQSARNYLAEIGRTALQNEIGEDFSAACDSDILDSFSYDIFPNFHLWGGFAQKICYRFRPVGCDPNRSLLEVMLFKIKPKGQEPGPAALRMLAEDELWSSATELGYLAGIFDQDQSNLGPIQAGLRDLGAGVIHFSQYQEMRCRNLHRMIDAYIDGSQPAGGAA